MAAMYYLILVLSFPNSCKVDMKVLTNGVPECKQLAQQMREQVAQSHGEVLVEVCVPK